MSTDALSVLIPILEDIVQWDANRIRSLFESQGFLIQAWDKVRTDWLTIRDDSAHTRSNAVLAMEATDG